RCSKMAYPPCLNPSCKSYGHPHPNCKCYSGMAKGGKVLDFCSGSRTHDKSCEYFSNGGGAGQDFDSMPDGPTTSFDDMVSDPANTPFDDMQDYGASAKYSSTGQQIGAGLEGVAQGVAGPLATLAEQGLSKLGVPGLTDEDIAGRQEANPITHGLGEAAGLIGGTLTGTG